jgi:hypothetical protein
MRRRQGHVVDVQEQLQYDVGGSMPYIIHMPPIVEVFVRWSFPISHFFLHKAILGLPNASMLCDWDLVPLI